MQLSKAYQTNMVLALGLIIIGHLLIKNPLFNYFGYAVLFLSVINEQLAIWIAQAWMKLGEFMGKISNAILMSFLFVLVLTPIALVKKVFEGKNRLNKSTWINYNNSFSTTFFERLW